ncbi:receptor like protein 6, partial [Prunus dulcis]
MFSLGHLQRLSLSDNNFNYSQIPSSIRNFPSLTHLDLSFSFFSNQVPSEVSHLSKLTYLNLCCNILENKKSPDNHRRLLKLQPSDMRITSTLRLSYLTQLTVFRVSTSSLTGPIPSWLGNFTKLVYLDFAFNQLSGSIPASFSNLINLEILYLHSNNLSGVVEFQMFQNLQNIYTNSN